MYFYLLDAQQVVLMVVRSVVWTVVSRAVTLVSLLADSRVSKKAVWRVVMLVVVKVDSTDA